MRKMTIVALVVGIMCLMGTAGAYAGELMDRIGEQQRRIDQGIASGSLTRQEAGLLQDNLNWIKQRFARLKADGRLTPWEQRDLEDMLDNNARMIADKKRNPIGKVYGEDLQERISNQQQRIDQGIMAGTLTRQEAGVVQDNLSWIKSTYSRMQADNRLSKKEVQRLTNMLNQNSRMIQDKKNNPARRLY